MNFLRANDLMRLINILLSIDTMLNLVDITVSLKCMIIVFFIGLKNVN